jgi:hypothetical protein
MSDFTRYCAAKSAAGWKAAGHTLKHFESKHPMVNGGCLLFAPLLTLFVWTIQLMILLTIAAWGAAWGVLAGIGAVIDACLRRGSRPIAHPSAAAPPAAPPPPGGVSEYRTASGLLVTDRRAPAAPPPLVLPPRP